MTGRQNEGGRERDTVREEEREGERERERQGMKQGHGETERLIEIEQGEER